MTRSRSVDSAGPTAVLVSEYVCGLLKPEERPQVHALLSRDDQALAIALEWEKELLSLVDALPRAHPSAALRERLQRSLGIGPPPALQPPPQPQLLRTLSRDPQPGNVLTPSPSFVSEPATRHTATAPEPVEKQRRTEIAGAPSLPRVQPTAAPKPPASPPVPEAAGAPAKTEEHHEDRQRQATSASGAGSKSAREKTAERNAAQLSRLQRKLWFWRLIGISATLAAIVGLMLPGEPPPPPVQVVKVAPTRAAILQAPGTTSTPAWTATLNPDGDLMMQPLVHTEVPAGSQALLWTRSTKIPEPRLLGRIDPNLPVQVPAAQLGALSEDQLLEITLETDEDAAKAIPNGPILFIGQMTVFGSEGAAVASDQVAAGTAAAGTISREASSQ